MRQVFCTFLISLVKERTVQASLQMTYVVVVKVWVTVSEIALALEAQCFSI